MKYIKFISIFFFICTGSLALINLYSQVTGATHFVSVDKTNLQEHYSEDYLGLTSLNKLVDFCDNSYYEKAPQTGISDTVKYINIVSDVVKRRFCHGLAEYRITDNWLLYLEGKLCWSHIAAIINPNDILKQNTALCSQQQLVFLSVLEKKSIPFRYVGLGKIEGPGHFVSEVLYGKKWRMSDVTFEPNWELTGNVRIAVDSLQKNKELFYRIYEKTHSRDVLSVLINHVHYGERNHIPGNKMAFFHTLNFVLIYLLPIFFFYLQRKIKT
ncbi:MAG TPA: hypothetical protein VK177_11700 [Flavobacteriales bacterium]|nr:hypothetical protein [Flavobacteriales bacterium]